MSTGAFFSPLTSAFGALVLSRATVFSIDIDPNLKIFTNVVCILSFLLILHIILHFHRVFEKSLRFFMNIVVVMF